MVAPQSALDVIEQAPGRFAEATTLAELRSRVDGLLHRAQEQEAASFRGTLRSYQREALGWLLQLHRAGLGGLLADDMGLGKTVQILAFLERLRSDGELRGKRAALVVAPRSVVGHWRDEASRFAPELEVRVHLGGKRSKAPSTLQRSDLVLTSYATMLRDLELLKQVSWTTVVFDEAQALKNPATKLRRGAAALTSRSHFCMSGTPVENHLGELWSQLDLILPGLVGRQRTFDAVFRRPIERYGDKRPLSFLRRRISPFLLRRRKDEVERELPEKTTIIETIELDDDQRDLYESLRVSLDKDIRRALKERGIHGSSMLILDALLKLRQVCCDPSLGSPRPSALGDLIRQARAPDGHARGARRRRAFRARILAVH